MTECSLDGDGAEWVDVTVEEPPAAVTFGVDGFEAPADCVSVADVTLRAPRRSRRQG